MNQLNALSNRVEYYAFGVYGFLAHPAFGSYVIPLEPNGSTGLVEASPRSQISPQLLKETLKWRVLLREPSIDRGFISRDDHVLFFLEALTEPLDRARGTHGWFGACARWKVSSAASVAGPKYSPNLWLQVGQRQRYVKAKRSCDIKSRTPNPFCF
jgi:hypothetical protein